MTLAWGGLERAYRVVALPGEKEGLFSLNAVEAAVGEEDCLGEGGYDECAGSEKDVVAKDHNE